MSIGNYILLQIILLLLHGLLTMSRVSMEGINPAKLKQKADDGDKKAIKIQKLVDNELKYTSAMRFLRLFIGFVGVAVGIANYAQPLANVIFPNGKTSLALCLSVFLITLILTVLYMLFGYTVPKRIGVKNAEALSEKLCGLNLFLSAVFVPVTAIVNGCSNVIVRIFGIDPKNNDEAVSEEDIVKMLDAGAEDGTLDADDIEYIKNVFQLEKLTAADVMTPRSAMELIDSRATDEEILKIIDESGYSRIPVYTDTVDNITGILFVRDYLLKRTQEDFKISQAINTATFVPETVHLDSLFKDMQMDHNHIVIVVDEYGGTAGLVTMEDILEELVGEIWDEQDEEIENFVKTEENCYKVLTSTQIDEFFEFFELPEDEEIESTTVNGWVTEHSGNIPQEGFSFEYKNLVVTVTKADDIRTDEVKVEVIPDQEETEDEE